MKRFRKKLKLKNKLILEKIENNIKIFLNN